MAAKNGAKYLKDTADPKGKYFNNENKKLSSNNRQGGAINLNSEVLLTYTLRVISALD